MRRFQLFYRILAIAVTFTACNSGSQKHLPVRQHAPRSLNEMYVDDIVPVSGGGAYAFGISTGPGIAGGVWYLSGSKASRVRAVGDSAARVRFESAALFEIQPTVDGGAYAYDATAGVWRIQGDSAVSVVEIPPSRSFGIGSSDSAFKFAWALYVHEHAKRKSAVDELESRNRPSDDQ